MVRFCRQVTQSRQFGAFILLLIIIAGILVGLETYPRYREGTPQGNLIQFVQNLILLVFVVEIAMKIIAFGNKPWLFFKDAWNVFDIVVVGVCLLPLHVQSATVVRMARILRTLRMITVLPRLRILVSALIRSIPSLGYIAVLLGLHFYIYSVIGTIAFGKNDPIRFGSLHTTATTLFQVLTLEGWNDVRDTQVMGSDVTYDEAWRALSPQDRTSLGQPVLATVYFVTFILLGTMIMLNLFTGVIITSIEEAQSETVSGGKIESSPKSERGYMTMQEEMNLITAQLHQISEQLSRMQPPPSPIASAVNQLQPASQDSLQAASPPSTDAPQLKTVS